jgi:hypothetical protein
MKTKTFFKDFVYPFPHNKATTFIQISKLFVNKALRSFFINHNIYKLKDNQLFGIIFKLRFEDESIRSMSTMIRADRTSFIKLTTLFKHLLSLRMNDYKGYKANQIIFTFHIFSEDYVDKNLNDEKKSEIISNKQKVEIDSLTKINFIKPNKSLFNLPLLFAGSYDFILQLTKLNPEISLYNDDSYKYKVIFNRINNQEVESKIVLQSDNTSILTKFIDKLIDIPKLDEKHNLIERSIKDEIYLIDSVNKELVLYKNINANKTKGYIKTLKLNIELKIEDLRKFITIDFETIKVKNKDHFLNIPVLLGYHDFYNNVSGNTILINERNNEGFDRNLLIQHTLEQFLDPKYNGFKIYAHNLSLFDGIFILKILVELKNRMIIKIEPLFRDRKLISIRVKYGYVRKNYSFKYQIEFRDSLLILLAPLSKLIKFFIDDKDYLKKYKDESKDLINDLISNEAETLINKVYFREKLIKYCINDCKALAKIIFKFSELIFKLFKMNIHLYPTISSLAFAIYRTHFLKSDKMIPRISGKIYKDISKAYTGGHCDVYRLYSSKHVHSYDVISLYPNEMFHNEFPVGKITYFKGNILSNKLNYTIEDLNKMKAFVKCDIFVDRSLNRPVYQTHVMINGQMRTMCATGTFKNQWVLVTELLKYQELTNNKIRIIEGSIKEGYLFKSCKLFTSYVDKLFKLKNSVPKSDPRYRIAKLLLNALYGRFGLKQILHIYNFVNNFEVESFSNGKNIKEVIDLIGTSKSVVITEQTIDDGISLDSSIPIAASVTAYARMYMAPLLLDEGLDILYTDTDSAKSTDKIIELDRYKHLAHNGLGGLKFEETLKESIFISPKVYGGILENDTSLVKIKGFKNKVEFNILKNLLLSKKPITLNQEKWFKNWMKSEILIKMQEYTLALNENKRQIDFKTLNTKPYHFDIYDPEK